MKYQSLLALLPLGAHSLPGMARDQHDMLAEIKRAAMAEPQPQPEPQLGEALGALGDTIGGLLGSVAESVNPDNKRPEPGYVFQEPGPGDSRGPCPGLNLLANYGYLPRNGHVNSGQIIDAVSRGFNMGTDLATVLAVFAVLANGDIETESWWLGADPTNKLGGLNRHSTVEADISPNREDYYLGCGDNHHLSSRLFKQNVEIVSQSKSKQFDIDAMGTQYAKIAQFSKDNNPYLYAFPFPQIVSVVAFNFYPRYFSNGTSGAGGVANYESISSIIGAKYNKATDSFEYVPERWPENWYRRATPYGAVVALTEGFTTIYPRNIVVPGASTIDTPNFSAESLLCEVYQGLDSVTPLGLSGDSAQIQSAVSWAIGKLDNVFDRTVLGCPSKTISPNPNSILFPNATAPGGPKNQPPSQAKNIGNNVYYKSYFKDAPVQPNCSPAF